MAPRGIRGGYQPLAAGERPAECNRRPRHSLLPLLLQEDAHAAILDLPDGSTKGALFAVLDGHGGAEVARFVANHLVRCWLPSAGQHMNRGAARLHKGFLLTTMALVGVVLFAVAKCTRLQQLASSCLPWLGLAGSRRIAVC